MIRMNRMSASRKMGLLLRCTRLFQIFGLLLLSAGAPLISLTLCFVAQDGLSQNTGKPVMDRQHRDKIKAAFLANTGMKCVQAELGDRALKYPLLAGKLEDKLLDAWEKASTDGLPAAVQMLKASNVTLAGNGQDVVVIVSLSPDVKLQDIEIVLKNRGLVILRSGPDTIKIAVPVTELDDIALIPGIQGVRAINPPRSKNTTKTEGISSTLATAWHTAGYTGQNVKFAVVDAGFANLATLKTADEIPTAATEVNYTGTPMTDGTSSHGSACAEIIYDIAPSVQMYLIKVDDPTDLIAAKDYCIANGIKVVTCSLGWDALNFHDGIACATPYTTAANHPVAAIDAALANGILWVMAGENEQKAHTLIDWQDSTANSFLDWDATGYEFNNLWINGSFTIPANTYISIYMTWNLWPSTSQDFDLRLYKWDGASLTWVGASQRRQTGTASSYPYEELNYRTTAAAEYIVVVNKYSASSNPKFILRYYCSNTSGSYIEPYYFGYDNAVTPVPGSICIPGDAASAFTAGAINYATYTTGPIESFSSLGPNNRAYTGGSAVTKPDICGPDRTTGVTDGSGGFAGTSAATPHIAALAALVKGAYSAYTPAQIKSYIEANGFDLGSAGKDNTYGSGAARLPSPPASTFTVTFNAQGGTTPVPPTKTVTNGQPYGDLATTARTGYTFGGWWTGSGGTGTQVTSGTTATLTGAQTLYAKWTANTYTVAYNGNGSTGGSTASSGHTYDVAKALTANGFTRTGYAFAGWATSAGGAVAFGNAQSVVNLTAAQGATVTLYAKWTANTYTVTFDAQGGTTPSPANKGVTYASTYGTLATTTRERYAFAGWWTEVGGTGTQVTAGTTVTITGAQTLYAKWTLVSTVQGTPCSWLNQYGLVLDGNYEAADADDQDRDGMLTWEEYIAGTIPTNSASLLRAIIDSTSGQNRICWMPDLTGAVPARVYSIFGSSNLLYGFSASPMSNNIPAGASVPLQSFGPIRFFKVGVGIQP